MDDHPVVATLGGCLALFLCGAAGASLTLEQYIDHQVKDAHTLHLKRDQLPQYLRDWTDLQRDQVERYSTVEAEHPTWNKRDEHARGNAINRAIVEDLTFAIDHAAEIRRGIRLTQTPEVPQEGEAIATAQAQDEVDITKRIKDSGESKE